jgi:hypothetical protein
MSASRKADGSARAWADREELRRRTGVSGSFTTASFSYVSEGHGGTDILEPPARSGHAIAASGLATPTHV